MRKGLLFVFLCCVLHEAHSDEAQVCKQKNSCHECIIDPDLCTWCSADNLKPEERCQPVNSEQAKKCPSDYLVKVNSTKRIERNDDFTSIKDHVKQIKPQKIKFKLRVVEQMEFEFSYKAVKDFPIDIYFLLDASNSMLKIRNDIANKSREIFDAMKNLTNDVYLGYGTFIDKNVIPFISSDQQNCYSFRHRQNLTSDLDKFSKALDETEFRRNFDPPESGLDGLGQVMACKTEVEFRPQSRKVIILITDNYSHYAGDGHAAGIYKPYDGKCYIDINGTYTKEKEMDYPSVSIISKLATDDQFTIFFLVTRYKDEYDALASAISGAMVSEYGDNSVTEQLKHFYKNISDNIQLDVNVAAEDKNHFEISFDPDCTQKNNCAVVIDEEKHIKGLIKLKEYYGKDNVEILIVQKGLKEELILNIEIITKCDCEIEGNYEVNARDCHFGGNLKCGLCDCYTDRSGPTCACVVNNTTMSDDTAPCVKDGVECSNAGICICGACSCRPGLGGKYCEVRTDNCKRDLVTGALCHGHGTCWNGTCHCNKMWEGDKCDCSTAKDLCISNGKECNNRGQCKCEQCQCNPLPKWDIRDSQDVFCNQKCDDCHTRQCRVLTDCLACYNVKNSTEECIEECGERLAVVTHNVTDDLKNTNGCVNARVLFGCYANFSYAYDDDTHSIVLYWTSEVNCRESYFKYGAISLLIAIIVGVAIMWIMKLLTDAHDRAEYKRFLSTPEDEDEVVNPVYKQPTNTFRNPNFKRSFNFR